MDLFWEVFVVVIGGLDGVVQGLGVEFLGVLLVFVFILSIIK